MSDQRETFTEQHRRAQLVQAAIETVNEVGYPRASLSAIARRAGVAKSAIVYYFSSKDALLLHVVDHVYSALDEALVEAVDKHALPRERLRAYATAYVQHVDRYRAEIAAGAEIAVSHRTTDGVPLYLTGTAEDSALLRTILEEGMSRGEFRTMRPSIAIGLVETLLDLATTEVQRDQTADLSELNVAIVDHLMRGLEVTAH